MRGIEAALQVCTEVRNGAFAAESLRKLYTNITSGDRTLAATLVYCTLRRQGLWKHLMLKYCRRGARELPERTRLAIMIGIAGIIELKYFALPVLINGIIQTVKAGNDEKNVGLVNAVLHTVADEAKPYLAELRKASALRDQALYWGVPGWAAAQWSKDTSIPDAKRLVRANGMRTYLSLRIANGTDRDEWINNYNISGPGRKSWASTFLNNSVRTAANPYPLDLPGYGEGKITPQSESSMFVAEALCKRWHDGPLLDMCCGRGVKTGQLADMRPDADVEAWEISAPRIKSAEFEMMRVHAQDRVKFVNGDALQLEPKIKPSVILLDAPCTGSGTWGRHPESKWRCTPEMVSEAAALQSKLIERAVSFIGPGGIVAYSTCSTFRQENEEVVAGVFAKHPELVEIPVDIDRRFMSRGRPYGTVIWPSLPWIDGFYLALLSKRK
jgi:16S rRNA (cytosine967-C5)-methyltransferase